ncbi:hypothetical protein [Saccharothrix texasensis]|uniref:hypothetical protein n=1 Tax=Saccharothrix texasensis TaxID=103734 RepID=UPI0011CD61DC|nr:hypothetical protein [Saccharothrix texasensis]
MDVAGRRISSAARRRLNDVMDAQRVSLGRTWRDVAARGGISYETLRAARNGSGDIPALTRAAMDRGLDWPAGTVDAILDGRVEKVAQAAVVRERQLDAAEERIVTATNQQFGEMLLEVMAVPTMTKPAIARWLVDALDMRDRYRAEQGGGIARGA